MTKKKIKLILTLIICPIIVGAVIKYLPENKTSISVESKNQSGGVTAQAVTYNDNRKKIIQVTELPEKEEYPRSEMVKKTIKQKEQELTDAVFLLEDALHQVKNGNFQYFKIIAGQLRALISSGSRSLTPLLLNLADEKSTPLICFAYSIIIPGAPASINDGLVMAMNPGMLISHKPVSRPSIRKYEFKKWLDMPVLVLNSKQYTPNEIIRLVAEKEGGAHYDDALPEKLIAAKGVVHHKGDFKYDETQKLLYQTAVVVIYYGEKILNS